MELFDASTDRLVCTKPFRPRNASGWPTLYPEPADYENPDAEPLYGYPVGALVNGGPWKPGEKLPEPNRLPKIFYDAWMESYSEPDPAISSQRWTMQLSRTAFRAGWTLDQTRNTMEAYAATGGGYWSFRCRQEKRDTDDPDRYDIQLWATLIESDRKRLPIGLPAAKAERPPFVLDVKDSKLHEILCWIMRHPEATQSELIRSRIVPPRLAKTVLAEMENRNMITSSMRLLPDSAGRMRKSRNWRLTSGKNAAADEVRDTIRATRIASNVHYGIG